MKTNHRRPLMPASMKAPTVKGQCRWCALPILTNDGKPMTRRTWHPECVTIYRVACFSGDQRAAVFKRDKGICAQCGVNTMKGRRYLGNSGHLWQADHIRPLIEGEQDLEYFLLTNLRTLCTACHKAETKALAGKRAKKRKEPPAPLPPLIVVPIKVWHGCYGRSWKGLVPDEIFEHPAKFSYLLAERIYRYAIEIGALWPGAIVGDPFGGVALGGVMARRFGLRWIGQELEPKFYAIGNKVLAHQTDQHPFPMPEWPAAALCLGDSRQFAEKVHAVMTSPPYADSFKGCRDGIDWKKAAREGPGGGEHQKAGRSCHTDYGDEAGNIGHLTEGNVASIITSPVYAETLAHDGGPITARERGDASLTAMKDGYGTEVAQIGRLQEGTVDGVIGSPPFGQREDGGGIGQTGETTTNALGRSTLAAIVGSPPYETINLTAERNFLSHKCPDRPPAKDNPREGYSGVDAILGSPPYETINSGVGGLNHLPAGEGQQGGRALGASQTADARYGDTEGQLAKLPKGTVEAVVSSPPWEDQARGHVGSDRFADSDAFVEGMVERKKGHAASVEARKAQFERDAEKTYGDTVGQIGKAAGETYWQAMNLVYRSCYQALRPGGYAFLVVKDYAKNWERVRLCDNTQRLLEHVGFETVERIHAMLVEEEEHGDLFAGTIVTKKARKSFFRKTYEKKPGAVIIDYEEVIIVRKPISPTAGDGPNQNAATQTT